MSSIEDLVTALKPFLDIVTHLQGMATHMLGRISNTAVINTPHTLIMNALAPRDAVPSVCSRLRPPHHRTVVRCPKNCTSAMIPARSMVRTLATLLLSARLEAFSLHPVHRRGTLSKQPHGSAADAVAHRGTSAAVSPSLWTEASGRGRGRALGMSVNTAVAEVTVTDLHDREFQVGDVSDT